MLKHVTAGLHFLYPARRIIAILLMLTISICCMSTIADAEVIYIIDDGQSRKIVQSGTYTPSAIAEKAGIEVSEEDRITSETTQNGIVKITITRPQDVTIRYMGATMVAQAYNETVSDFLARMNVPLDDQDEVSIDLSSYTEDGMIITVTDYSYGEATGIEPVTYSTKHIAVADMAKGTEEVVTEGKNGTAEVTYSVTYKDGVEVARDPISSKVIVPPTAEVVKYGTKASKIASSDRIATDDRNDDGSGILTFKSGDTLVYSHVINASATAYYAKPDAKTASGKTVYVGGVAVDPKVIPLGTNLYITTPSGSVVYGYATAIDTGGAVKGNIVDLFYYTYEECVKFGRRPCTVYVLVD